jgi:metal-responsive CopG/Arc/MetJ family transcriptional regulator
MATVKTAISIQQSLFDQVNSLAEELQMPRSRLFVLAVEEFVRRHQNYKLLEALNKAYADAPDPNEKAWRGRMRQQHRELVEEQW